MTYRNQCYDTEIIKANRGSYQIPLYKSDTKTYSVSAQTIAECPKITESLVLLDSSAETPVDFVLDFGGYIQTNPKTYENLGSYRFVVRSCIDIDNGATPPMCADSQEWTVQITDPCVDNSIISAPISTTMKLPQL